MIALVIQYLCTNGKDTWHFSGKFDQHFSLYCDWFSKTEIQERAGMGLVLVRVL